MAEEAVRRYTRSNPFRSNSTSNAIVPSSGGNAVHFSDTVVEIRKTRGCILLDPEDLVVDVLDDNDFVSIRMENDMPDTAATAGSTMGHFDHSLPEPFVASHLKPDTPVSQLIEPDVVLDGQHLSVKDLVLLSKGLHKIKLRKIAEDRVAAGRQLVDAILKENKVYTVTNNSSLRHQIKLSILIFLNSMLR